MNNKPPSNENISLHFSANIEHHISRMVKLFFANI